LAGRISVPQDGQANLDTNMAFTSVFPFRMHAYRLLNPMNSLLPYLVSSDGASPLTPFTPLYRSHPTNAWHHNDWQDNIQLLP
jgi:hypothetical protein